MKNFYNNKKVLITGHTGFKGSWLTQMLINWGAKIIGVSLPPNTTPNLFDSLGLKSKLYKNYFEDIRDYNKMKEIFEHEKPEIVFHLAAQPLVRDSYDDPLTTHSSNIMGTANILQAIKEVGGVKSAVIITTDKVYENKECLYPYRETDALGGYDPYSASKAAADIVVNSYIQSFFNPKDFGLGHNTLIAIARAGNVIGGGDWAKDRLVPNMVRAIFEYDESVTIRNPQAVRPWQHVLEPLVGYLMLGQRLYNGDREMSGAWNFGPHEEGVVCVEELVQKGIGVLGKGSHKVIKDYSKHEAGLLKLDISKAVNILGWRPKWNFHDGLRITFEWYDQYYRDPQNIEELTNQQIRFYLGD
ncbi:MAG: CDP-glucose 4,6-dehydratase [Candidatus Magasanikbacteria bacterium]|jgi:CDP-glucose 4,6-dehydratase